MESNTIQDVGLEPGMKGKAEMLNEAATSTETNDSETAGPSQEKEFNDIIHRDASIFQEPEYVKLNKYIDNLPNKENEEIEEQKDEQLPIRYHNVGKALGRNQRTDILKVATNCIIVFNQDEEENNMNHRDQSHDESAKYELCVGEAPNLENKEDEEQKEEEIEIKNRINTKVLNKYDETYGLERFEKNALIVINNEHFKHHRPRIGTQEDVKAICETFSKFDFERNVYQDLSKVDLFGELQEYSKKDFTDYGCIVIVILTLGAQNGLLSAADEYYSELDVINCFKSQNNPTLFTKPVIFLIQGSRGPHPASSVEIPVMGKLKFAKDLDDTEPYYLPVEADMLIAHSSFVGKPSFRTEHGSWFIQTVCKYINELYITHDLESILVEVKRDIAINKYYMEFNQRTQDMNMLKQMPTITSTLIRKLYLRKFRDAALNLPPIDQSYNAHEQIENAINESINKENKTNEEQKETQMLTKYNEINNTKPSKDLDLKNPANPTFQSHNESEKNKIIISQSSNIENKEDEEHKEEEFEIKNNDQINSTVLSKYDRTYGLERFKKNAIIIFNHENIKGFKPRTGTKQDVNAICETFSKFGFVDIQNNVHNDLSMMNLFEKLKEFSEQDFTDYGCIVVVILTHGTKNGLLRASDAGQLYSELDVINHFKSQNRPTLLTKPVVLLIQACRGDASTVGMSAAGNVKIAKDDDDIEPYHLPVEADMLIAHSSFVGKSSFRPESGSWFIQTLCKYIDVLHRTHDLESILVEVKREIATDKYYSEFNEKTGTMDVNKQIPTTTATLTRRLYLRKYGDDPLVMTPIERHRVEAIRDSIPDILLSRATNVSCSCFLTHFAYMKKCLSHYVDQNPSNTTAKCILGIAATLNQDTDVETITSTLRAISDCLHNHCRGSEYHNYIHYYHEHDGLDSENTKDENIPSKPIEQVKNCWYKIRTNYTVKSFGTYYIIILSIIIGIAAYVVYT